MEEARSALNVLALVKGSERYVFVYDDASTATLLQTFGRYAADRTLSFNWYDAAVLSERIRGRRTNLRSCDGFNNLDDLADV